MWSTWSWVWIMYSTPAIVHSSRPVVVEHRVAAQDLIAAVAVDVVEPDVVAVLAAAPPVQFELVVEDPERRIEVDQHDVAPAPSPRTFAGNIM